MTSRKRHHRKVQTGNVGREGFGRERGRSVDPAAVARLSAMQIEHMTQRELADVVRAGRLPGDTARAEYLDRGTLERLAYLARLSCRNRSLSTKPR